MTTKAFEMIESIRKEKRIVKSGRSEMTSLNLSLHRRGFNSASSKFFRPGSRSLFFLKISSHR
jgi:hypothetical protein